MQSRIVNQALPRVQHVVLAAVICGFLQTTVAAQGPADLDVSQKTEIFIQHIVKIAKVDPEKSRALILEYEIGSALAELLHSHQDGEEAGGHSKGEPSTAFLVRDFVERALKELHPPYARLATLLQKGKLDEAISAARDLEASSDPYLAAHASLARAEALFRSLSKDASEEDLQAIIRLCERISSKDRLYLVGDYKACEMIARCFERSSKPLMEFLQYAILLTDYYDLPDEVNSAAKKRLAALSKEVGFPLGTVADWMNSVEKLLAREVTATDPTQRQETSIVYALDKLIELQEARERKTCKNCGQSGCRGGCRSGPPKGNRSNNPAQVSALAQAKGEFLLRGVSQGSRSTIWGQLKAKDASKAMQAFKGKLPARYQRLLEQYYKNLSTME